MIRWIDLGCLSDSDLDQIVDPPERVLRVEVIGGVAHLRVYRVADDETMTSEYEVEVNGPSLLRAVGVLLEDEAATPARRLQQPPSPAA